MTEFWTAFAHNWNLWLGSLLCFSGGIMALIGAIGVTRFPDFYTRLHAASVTDTAAVFLLMLGMGFLAGISLVTFKLFLIWLLLFITSPAASHALANAAHTAGLEPVLDKDINPPAGADADMTAKPTETTRRRKSAS